MTLKIDGADRSILVIDDDLAIRVLLQAVLKRMSFAIELAEDGQVGLEKLARDRFDLVLLDLMMPKVNGYEFLQEIKTLPENRQPDHIIVFTAAGKRGLDRIPEGAVCSTILKPFDLERFVEMIDDCLSAKHSLRA